jgi:hypothetical protein
MYLSKYTGYLCLRFPTEGLAVPESKNNDLFRVVSLTLAPVILVLSIFHVPLQCPFFVFLHCVVTLYPESPPPTLWLRGGGVKESNVPYKVEKLIYLFP